MTKPNAGFASARDVSGRRFRLAGSDYFGSRSAAHWWTFGLSLFLIAMVLIAYAQAWQAQFIWDDEAHLTRNPCVIGPLGLKEIWTSAQAVYYPLVLTTFWFLHKFVGLHPVPYHVLNVLLHAGSAVLLWRVLRQLGVRAAWFGAALWALHPVMVQSVAWVTELKNTQSGLFYLLSVMIFLNADARRSRDTTYWCGIFAALLFFVLAILSKPSTVMLPAVLGLCIWWRRGRIRWDDVLLLLPFILISVTASAWTIWEQKFHAGAIGPDWAQTWPERVIIASRAIWFYLGKLVWPHPLIFIYPRWQIDAQDVIAFLPALLTLVAIVALWINRDRKWIRPICFSMGYFVILLFPVLGFFSVYFFHYSFVSDHFQYLASMGPLALLAATIDAGTQSLVFKPYLQIGVRAVLLGALGLLSWQQTAIYRNLETLYSDTLTKNPGCWMAHYNFGIMLRSQGETDEAIAHYRQAIALRPQYVDAHYNLGRLLVEKGNVAEAIGHYQRAVATDLSNADAHNNFGSALFEIGRVDDAIAQYEQALGIHPDYADALFNLAKALVSQGELDRAIFQYEKGLAVRPDEPNEHYHLGNVLLQKGRTDDAIVHYQRTLQLRPDNVDAHTNLGNAYLQKGDFEKAITQYRAALRIASQNIPAQINLAWLLATCSEPSLRDGQEAVALAEEANLHSGGDRPIVLRILGAAYAETGRFDDAVRTAEHALELAHDQNNTMLINALPRDIRLYQSGVPYRKK